MQDDQNLLLVPLQPSDQEYKDVVKEFTSTLGRTPSIIKVIACTCQISLLYYLLGCYDAGKVTSDQEYYQGVYRSASLWCCLCGFIEITTWMSSHVVIAYSITVSIL